jgi:hypothetical protein
MRRVLPVSVLMMLCVACGPVDESDMQPEPESLEMKTVEMPLSGACTGWHYVTWPTAGLRRWNTSSCGGTVHCTLRAGDWVYVENCTYGGCDAGPADVYVHNTPCGFGGWVRADALN